MELSGSIVAIVTPFGADGALDLPRFERLVEWHIAAGTSAIVVAGTTGESTALTATEYVDLMRCAVGTASGRLPIIAGTGSASTDGTIARTREAAALGAAAALVVTPYYVRPPQRGLVAHYRAVADACEVPVILYNVPGRTGVDLQPDAVVELADHPHVVGLKEANARADRMPELVRRVGGQIALLSGDDDSCAVTMRQGATGVISVASNVAPKTMADLCRACRDENAVVVTDLTGRLQPLFKALAIDTNPIPVKAALSRLGLIENILRLPLASLRADDAATLAAALEQVGEDHP